MAAPPDGEAVYRVTTRIFASVILVLGIAMVITTIAAGGGIGAVGLWLGLLFTGLGAARLYLSRRS